MPRLDAERVAVWQGLGRLVDGVRRELDAELVERHDLPLLWFEVLGALRDGGGSLRVVELAAHLGDVVSSTSRRLARMAAQGLVERSAEPVGGDHRSVTVTLTAGGRAAWREANVTYRRAVQHRFAAKVTDSDLVVLQRLLSKTAL
ncbi:MAG: MarR family transcriptional regulator [Ilumatobacteraceae bacterium]